MTRPWTIHEGGVLHVDDTRSAAPGMQWPGTGMTPYRDAL